VTTIAVFGAGAIGCWVAGYLALGGDHAWLIGRQRLVDELAGRPLTISELGAPSRTTLGFHTTTDPAVAASADVTFVAVKSTQTAEAGAALARVLPANAVVVSLQNGVRNADVLRAALPECRVLAGMVPFNVIRRAPGAYHRATAGTLMIEDAPAAAVVLAAAKRAGLPIEARRDMLAVQWAKLVLNLNNAINALSGLPLAEELGQRDYRRVLAAAQREALAALARANQPLAQLTPVPARWLPRILELPDLAFRLAARQMLAIDPSARSSMWDDFEARRPTEIDYLQGEVVALAERHGLTAPVNAALVKLVRIAEGGGRRDYTGAELLASV
jgi:2-dehydropantoate 2-reductase